MVPDPSSTSSAIAVTERFDTSLRGRSSSSYITSVLSSQSIRTLPVAVSNNSSSVSSPSVVYNFQNCTAHHVGSSMPNSSSSLAFLKNLKNVFVLCFIFN